VVGERAETPRNVTIGVYTLWLNGKSCIKTNGHTLYLTVVDLLSSGGTILSFGDEELTPADAPPGSPGINGRDGGKVVLRVLRQLITPLAVSLRGQNGGRGGSGTVGPPGTTGGRGSDAVQGLFDCRAGGQDGGPGTSGGQGTPGLPGGKGGDGGILVLQGVASSNRSQILHNLDGGARGPGGSGGLGGAGGPGGQGGSGAGLCRGGHGGPTGPTGPVGQLGTEGAPGIRGKIE